MDVAVAQNIPSGHFPVVAKLETHTQARVGLLCLGEKSIGFVDALCVAAVDLARSGGLWLEDERELLGEAFSEKLQDQDDG